METEKTTITIKNIFENPKPPHKILDTTGAYWKIWGEEFEQLNLKKNHAYEIKYKPGEYRGKPDNTIRTAILVGAAASPSAATGPAVAANGHAEPVPIDRDCIIWIECILGRVWKDKIPLGDGDSLLHAAEVAKDVYYQLIGNNK